MLNLAMMSFIFLLFLCFFDQVLSTTTLSPTSLKNNKPNFWKDFKRLISRSPFSKFNRVVRILSSELKENDELSLLYHPESGNIITLIGTIHIAEESANLVRDVIQKVRPSVVMIELDIRRFAGMIASQGKWQDSLGVIVPKSIFLQSSQETERTNNFWSYCRKAFHPLINFFSEISSELKKVEEAMLKIRNEFDYGGEFRVAYEEGRKVGAKILLGDKGLSASSVKGLASAFKSKRGEDAWTTVTSDLQGLEESTFSLMKKVENFNRELKED
eukprot:gene6056-6510_t